jgi:hypothetical protein
MNPLVLLTGVVARVLLGAVALHCARNGKLPHLLLACCCLGGIGATWLSLRQLFLRGAGDWRLVALLVAGLCAILASAMVAKRILAPSQTGA